MSSVSTVRARSLLARIWAQRDRSCSGEPPTWTSRAWATAPISWSTCCTAMAQATGRHRYGPSCATRTASTFTGADRHVRGHQCRHTGEADRVGQQAPCRRRFSQPEPQFTVHHAGARAWRGHTALRHGDRRGSQVWPGDRRARPGRGTQADYIGRGCQPGPQLRLGQYHRADREGTDTATSPWRRAADGSPEPSGDRGLPVHPAVVERRRGVLRHRALLGRGDVGKARPDRIPQLLPYGP